MAQSIPVQKLDAQLNRTRLSADDFKEASEYIKYISEVGDNDVLKRALLTAAVVCYARPFTNNQSVRTEESTSQLSVSPKKIFKTDELMLHEKLLALRNEAVAHTEYNRKPVKRLEGTPSGFVMSGKLFDLVSERIDLALFNEMCSALNSHCVRTMFELNDKIVEADSESKS